MTRPRWQPAQGQVRTMSGPYQNMQGGPVGPRQQRPPRQQGMGRGMGQPGIGSRGVPQQNVRGPMPAGQRGGTSYKYTPATRNPPMQQVMQQQPTPVQQDGQAMHVPVCKSFIFILFIISFQHRSPAGSFLVALNTNLPTYQESCDLF